MATVPEIRSDEPKTVSRIGTLNAARNTPAPSVKMLKNSKR